MDRFRILRGLPPKPIKWDNCPKCVLDDDIVAIIVPSDKATKETADILYSQVPKPYAVFVSDDLDLVELIHLAEDSQKNGSYQMARRPLRVYNDHEWSHREMEMLHSLKFNFLRNASGMGFQIWSDSVIGAQWRDPQRPLIIENLSNLRILRFIDKGENLFSKYNRAVHCLYTHLITGLTGDPIRGFTFTMPSIRVPLTFESNESLFIGNRRE